MPRHLTATSVRTNAPASPGIYGLSNAREWIFIGESDNIQASLLEHLQQGYSAMMKKLPTGFVFEVRDSAGRAARREQLVFEYEPWWNRTPRER